jgi:tetratricopeptide (TPR) repeat protein
MKNIFISLLAAGLIFSNTACGPNSDNTNHTNTNTGTPAATPTADTNQNTNSANSNLAGVKKNEPVPTFTDATTAFTEGNKYFDKNETEKAIEAFKQAVKLNPDLAEAHFQLGVALALLEKEAESTTKINEPEPTKTPKKGKEPVAPKKESEKAFENAVKAYQKVLAKNPKDDAAHFNLARSYNKLNKDKEAEKAIRQAVKLKPEDSEYQTELAAILIKFAKYDEAVTVLKKALKLDETNSQAQDLLEKAEAGKKRQEYGLPKDKPKVERPETVPSKEKPKLEKPSNTAPTQTPKPNQ